MKYNSLKHLHSQTGFVLIEGHSKAERPVRWEWLTQRNLRQSSETQEESLGPKLSYSEKKRILSGLECESRRMSNFKIKTNFTLTEKIRVSSSAGCKDLKNDKKIQPFIYLNSKENQMSIPAANFGIDTE